MNLIERKPISLNQIAMLEQHQLKNPVVEKYLDLSNSTYVYDCLKKLSEKQYRFLNALYMNKETKMIIKILKQVGIKEKIYEPIK